MSSKEGRTFKDYQGPTIVYYGLLHHVKNAIPGDKANCVVHKYLRHIYAPVVVDPQKDIEVGDLDVNIRFRPDDKFTKFRHNVKHQIELFDNQETLEASQKVWTQDILELS